MVRGGEGARPGNLRDARHAERGPGRAAEATPGSTTTTTTSTPRPSSTARSSRTRDYQDRLDTLEPRARRRHQGLLRRHRRHGRDRARSAPALIAQLANLDPYPESVPINNLVQVEGTPLARHATPLDPFEFVRTIAVARITMPQRDGAPVGRPPARWAKRVQALCFLAGANSIFYGDKLLTTGNPQADAVPEP